MSVIRKENWKSDIRLAVTLLVGGEAVHVPSHAFTLRFKVCNGQTYYDCWRDDGGVYHNCRPNDDGSMLLCFLDNHKLGLGALHCEYYDYAPDADFADGNKLTVVPQVLPIELVAGAGDDAEQVDAEVIVAIDGLVGDAQEAIAAATDAASRANEASSRAETATADAVEAATDALRNGEDARQAASAANAAAVRANDAAEAGMALCERASETATSAANAANVARVNAEMAASVANQAASRADGAATDAAKAAEHAETAANLATAAAGKIDDVLDIADGLDNRWSLANYGNVRIVSEGFNDPQRSLRVVFDSLNEITLTERDGSKLSTSVRGGTTYVVPDGSALWMNHRTGELHVGDIAGADDVSLVECSRGLMSGGVFVDLLADYTHHRAASDVAAALEKKANLTSLYRFAGFSIVADGSPEDAAMDFGPYVDVLSSKLDTYCPGWGDVADHRSILQLIRWNNAGSYNSEYLFTGAFGDGLRRAASEAHELGFNSLVFPADLVVYEAGVDMLEERIDAVERDKADKSEIDALIAGAPEALDTLKEIADKLSEDDGALAGLLSEVAGKQDKMLAATTIPATGLLPNVCYDYGTTDSVSVTLATNTDTVADFYLFRFTCLSASCVVTLPSACKLPVDATMEMAAGRRFEVVIDEDMCVTFNSWD